MPITRTKPHLRNGCGSGPLKRRVRSAKPIPTRLDAATIASQIQLQEQRREFIYSSLALVMKLGLVTLGAVSLLKLCLAYNQRLSRYSELSVVLDSETIKMQNLQKRFDRLFTIGGSRRLLDEQDHWIAPNRLRVIWK